jgi:tetratricopeptide (TPR) repeat protein
MRGHGIGVESVDILTRVLRAEFPELDAERLRAAVERAVARVASASLDTEGYAVVDLHLAKAEATEESEERSKILRELAENLEERGDADRALAVRLAAFSEVSTPGDVFPLLRLARITERWTELPLDNMSALIDIQHADAAKQLAALADAWQHVGRPYYAADCLERVLLIDPANTKAFEALEVFYRSTNEWPVLIDLLGRRAVQVESEKERAELFREMAFIYDKELSDASAALDAYREADQLEPNRPEVLEGLARLSVEVGVPEEEALSAAERFGAAISDPKDRAKALVKAADIAKLQNWDKAQELFEQARAADPDLAAAVDGLATLLRDRGQLSEAITLIVNAAERNPTERPRWLVDAADFCVALGDTDWAKQLYRDARAADPGNMKAGVALVELGWEGHDADPAELIPILDQLCRTTDDPSRLRTYLIQRSKLALQVGERTQARNLLARAVELDPEDVAPRKELAEMLFDAGQWVKARQVMETLLVDEDLLDRNVAVELHYRVAKCARELGDIEAAQQHVDVALVLQPDHRPALVLRTELGKADPHQLVADQLALASTAPPDERAALFQAIGDRYIELGDRAAAREMYREAITHRPGDHLLLTKFLELVADDGDWSYSLDVVRKLIETEKDPKVRARYRHLAGMIARDELDAEDQATELFTQAIDDDPAAFSAADELESMLAHGEDRQALAAFYYKRLEHMREHESRPGERLRLWDLLGELLIELDQYDDAVVAFEVASSLDPDNIDRKKRLADLYSTDTKHDTKAIAQHQAILRADKRRLESFKALRQLYDRTRQADRARAVHEAIEVIASRDDSIGELFEDGARPPVDTRREGTQRTLSNEDFVTLARLDVDLTLSALFAVVAPPFAVERARMRPPLAVPSKEPEIPVNVQKAFLRVADTFGISPRPPAYFEREQAAPCKMAMRLRDGILTPVLVFGRPVIDKATHDHELTFTLARQLADLRTERIARLLCPRAGELAQIIELAMGSQADSSSAAKWLTSALHPVELEQARQIGSRLRDRAIHPMTAAVGWLAATERAADRIGFVVAGDLAKCVRLIEQDASITDPSRVTELVWASVTEEVLGVRSRVECWSAVPPPVPHRATEARRSQ